LKQLLFLPIITIVIDRDLSDEMILRYPAVYKEGANSMYCNLQTFLRWMFRGIVQAAALFLVIYLSYGPQHVHSRDQSGVDVEELGISAFVAYLWVQSLTLNMMMHSLSVYHFVLIWGMFIFTVASLYVTSVMILFDHFTGYYVVREALIDSQLWFVHILIVAITLFPLVWLRMMHLESAPLLSERIQIVAQHKRKQLPEAQEDGDYFYYN